MYDLVVTGVQEKEAMMVVHRIRWWLLVVTVLLVAVLVAFPAMAHVVLLDPQPRTDDTDLTTAPCGGKSQGDPVASYAAGTEIEVTFDLTVQHTMTTSLYVSFDGFDTRTKLGMMPTAESGIYSMTVDLPAEPIGPAVFQLIHQDYYSCADVTISEKPEFVMNAGLNDAWFNPLTDGQGFFITVFPGLGFVSMAWFTYDTELPSEDAAANLGDAGHRWITALGPVSGNQAIMNIEMTSGGLFDTSTEIQRTDPPGSDGTILLTFTSCSTGTVEYDIPSINRQGSVPIQRVADDNVALCEALNSN